MATPNIVPRADSEGGLGTASKYWASAYIDAITTTGNITVGGVITATTFNGIPFFSDATNNSMYTHDVSGTDDTAARNTAYGFAAMDAITTGDDNVAVGRTALSSLNTGISNVAIGSGAGDALTTGSNNIIIGYTAAASAVDVSNTTVIGTGTTTNAIVHGLRKSVNTTATNVAAPRINNIYNFSDADGATVTLPDSGGGDYIGASFEFVCSIAATSNSHKIVCTDTTNELILGALTMVDTDTSDAVVGMAAEVDDSFSAVSFNGTTTGGRIGTKIKITNIAADKWFVEGTVLHSGGASTPFATS
jgi:hypothetical protein